MFRNILKFIDLHFTSCQTYSTLRHVGDRKSRTSQTLFRRILRRLPPLLQETTASEEISTPVPVPPVSFFLRYISRLYFFQQGVVGQEDGTLSNSRLSQRPRVPVVPKGMTSSQRATGCATGRKVVFGRLR